MNDEKSFWTTLRGIITGIAAVITVIAGIVGLLYQMDIVGPQTLSVTLTPTPPPLISVFPDPFFFNIGSMSAGETASRTFSISNAGGGTLTWSVSDDQPWITVNPTSGTNSGTVTLNINTVGLSPGSYTGTITVTSNGGTKTGTISLTVPTPKTTPTPLISVSPDPFFFNIGSMSAGETASRTFSISNAGGGTLTWSVSDDQPWITVNPTSGTNSGTVTLTINTAGLSSGSHTGTITLTSNGGTKTGTISLTVPPQMIDFVGIWINIDENTKGITKIEIQSNGDYLDVRTWGKCYPTDCDWGKQTVLYEGGPLTVVYTFSFMVTTNIHTLLPNGTLHVNSDNVFTDGTNRDYKADYYFIK